MRNFWYLFFFFVWFAERESFLRLRVGQTKLNGEFYRSKGYFQIKIYNKSYEREFIWTHRDKLVRVGCFFKLSMLYSGYMLSQLEIKDIIPFTSNPVSQMWVLYLKTSYQLLQSEFGPLVGVTQGYNSKSRWIECLPHTYRFLILGLNI